MLINNSLLLLLATLTPLGVSAAGAPDITADVTTHDAPETADRELRQKRVLHLYGGQTVRALTQYVDGNWQLRRNGKWQTIDGNAVIKWRSETDLLREARNLSRDMPAKDLARRAAYAQWLVQEGLVEEATEQLNAILHLDPDQAAALKLLKSRQFARPRAGNPEAEPQKVASTLIGAGMSAGPVRRELLILSLRELQGTEAGKEVLRKELLAGLHSSSILKRTFSAHAMRRLLAGEQLFPLMQRCILDVSKSVRTEASLAVRAAGDPGLILPIVKALGSNSRAVRTNAAESLGQVGYALAVPALVTHFANLPQSGGGGVMPVTSHIYVGREFAYVQDFDLEIAQGSSIADPIVRTVSDAVILDARVGGVGGTTYVTEYRTVYASLKSLTKANPGSSPQDWQQWFDDHREDYEAK